MKVLFRMIVLAFFICVVSVAIYGSETKAAADPQCELINPTKLGTYGDIELWGEKEYKFTLPCDRIMIYQVLVKNTSDKYKSFKYLNDIKINAPSGIKSHLWIGTIHPQPNWFHLQPKSERMMQITVEALNKDGMKNYSKKPVSLDMDFEIGEVDNRGSFGTATKHSLNISSTVTTISQKSLTKGKKCTVKICGYLKNSKGKPIKNANVLISAGWCMHNSVFTNNKGYYSVKVKPYYSKYRKMWSEYAITPRVKGYKTKTIIVKPAKKKIKKTIKLKKQTSKISYKQTKKINLGIQAYELDASADGSVIATLPFHTLLPKEQTEGKRKLTVVDKSGTVLFQKDIPSEAPYADVSDDGNYIVITSEYAGDKKSNAVIFDKEGNELYRTPDQLPLLNHFTKVDERDDYGESYCARLSNDNRLLAYSSTDGDFWLFDWKKNKLLWYTCIEGQIRTIDFSADDSTIYMSAGGGFAYAFDTANGEQKWSSFIQGWGTEAVLTDKYYIVTTKSDGYALIVLDAKTGKKVWDYPVDCRGTGLSISPDGKKLWWGDDKGGDYSPVNSAIFDLKTGKLLTVFSIKERYSAMVARWSKDGKKILIKDGRGFGVYDSSTGEPFFEKNVVGRKTADSLCFSLYASDDLKYVVAGFNTDTDFRFGGQLFFFKQK